MQIFFQLLHETEQWHGVVALLREFLMMLLTALPESSAQNCNARTKSQASMARQHRVSNRLALGQVKQLSIGHLSVVVRCHDWADTSTLGSIGHG